MSSAIRAMGRIDDCAVWQVALDAPMPASWRSTLSRAELQRAARFAFEKDRLRYEAAHGALRELLAPNAQRRAGDLRFEAGPFGKPGLADVPGLEFNLSHSQDLAVVAIGGEPLGVDVEVPRTVDDLWALSEAHFTEAEQDALARVDTSSRAEAFLRCWTRKEACLKALGLGLSLDTRTLEVGLGDGSGTAMAVDAGPHGGLSVQSFMVGPSAVAALAVAVTARQLVRKNAAALELTA